MKKKKRICILCLRNLKGIFYRRKNKKGKTIPSQVPETSCFGHDKYMKTKLTFSILLLHILKSTSLLQRLQVSKGFFIFRTL